MKIGIDARYLSYESTGIPVYLRDYIRCWNKMDVDAEFYLYSNRPFDLETTLGHNWHTVIDPYRHGGIWVKTRLARLIKKDDLDVFWEPMHILPSKVRGTAYYVTVNDLTGTLHPELTTTNNSILERLFLKSSCKRADGIIAISNSTKRDIVGCLDVPEEKVAVVYCGDSPYKQDYPALRREEDLQLLKKWELSGQDYLLFVSTIEPRKNVLNIVKAYERARAQGGIKEKLILAGKIGWKCKAILEAIDQSDYRSDIVVTGYVSENEKRALYYNATALLYPSRYEGFGLPLVEAMSVGIPIVTSMTSSMPEVGGDVPFYLKDIDDIDQLGKLILMVCGLTLEERKRIYELGKQRAQMFDRSKTALELLQILMKKDYS